MDILDLSEVDIPAGVFLHPAVGLRLRMVKELDLQLALGMDERRKTGSLPVYVGYRRFETQTDPKLNLSVQLC